MKLTRWSQRVASLRVGRCVQQPFFEEVTEESLEKFVNKYVKRLGLWSDTTIHHEPFKKWMVCIVSLDVQNIPFRTISSPNKTEDLISCYSSINNNNICASAIIIRNIIIKDMRRGVCIPQLYIWYLSGCWYGKYAYNPDGGGFGVIYIDEDGDRNKRRSMEEVDAVRRRINNWFRDKK